jgi:hypothetical protein
MQHQLQRTIRPPLLPIRWGVHLSRRTQNSSKTTDTVYTPCRYVGLVQITTNTWAPVTGLRQWCLVQENSNPLGASESLMDLDLCDTRLRLSLISVQAFSIGIFDMEDRTCQNVSEHVLTCETTKGHLFPSRLVNIIT